MKKRIISMLITLAMVLSFTSVVPAAEAEVWYNAEVKLMSGDEQVYNVETYSQIRAVVTIPEASAAADAALVLAQYNGEKLEAVIKEDISIIVSSESQSFDADLTVVPAKGNYAKVFLWDAKTLKPLSNVYDSREASFASVSLEGIYQLYETVDAVVDYNGNDTLTYEWLYSAEENGTYTPLDTTVGDYSLISNNGASIQLLQGAESVNSDTRVACYNPIKNDYTWNTPLMAYGDFSGENSVVDKYIKVRVADTKGNIAESEPKKVGGSFGSEVENSNWDNALGWSSAYDGSYDFKVDGKSFTLLDTTESDTSKYFVIANDDYADYNYDIGQQFMGGWAYFSMPWVTSEWLNSGVLDLPTDITNHIDNNHWWANENYEYSRNNNMYYPAVKAGISIPSVAEMTKYGSKISKFGTVEADAGFWTRTPSATQIDYLIRINMRTSGVTWGQVYNVNNNIRPVFYLDKDFFKEVEVTDAGANIKPLLPEASVSVEAVELEGIYQLYETVDAVVTAEGSKRALKYEWLYSAEENGTYTPLDTAVGDYSLLSNGGASIQLLQGAESVGNTADQVAAYNPVTESYTWSNPFVAYGDFSGENSVLDKYIKVRVTDTHGNTVESEPRKVGGSFGTESDNANWDNELGWSNAYDGSYDFKVEGKSFTLLDTTESDTSKYFVIANDDYADYNYDIGGQFFRNGLHTTHHWVTSEWLNSGVLGLPEGITSHVDNNHWWACENSSYFSQPANIYNYAVKAGISIPSVAEMTKYGSKISKFGTVEADAGFWTRTPAKQAADYVIRVNMRTSGVVWAQVYNVNNNIRPVFYLDKDFFNEVEVTDAGANIKPLLPPAEVTVESVSMEGFYQLYETIDAVTVSTGDKSGLTYEWLYSAEENGAYTPLDTTVGDYSLLSNNGASIQLLQGAESVGNTADQVAAYNPVTESYTWSNPFVAYGDFSGENSVLDKYIKVRVTDTHGNIVESEPRKVSGSFGTESDNANWENSLGWSNAYDGSYDFTLDGKSFTVLDVTESDTSKYFVIANDDYADYNYDIGGQFFRNGLHTTHHWVTSEWLNSGVLGLPEGITSHVDNNHWWACENSSYFSQPANIYNYAVKAGISIPSVAEMMKYGAKISKFGTAEADAGFWTRTPAKQEAAYVIRVNMRTGGVVWAQLYNVNNNIRPVFYLDKDFFSQVRVENVGSELIAQIDNDCNAEALTTLYGTEDYKTVMEGGLSGNFKLAGIFESYQEISGDTEELSLDSPSYQWYSSDNAGEGYTAIDGATNETYILTKAEAGKYVQLKITSGDTVYESSSQKIDPAWEARIGNGKIEGVMKETHPEYEFSVDGVQYILLNTTGNEQSKYLILRKHTVTDMPYASNGKESQIFNTDTDYIGGWLNNEYMSTLPAEMQNAINKNQVWKIDIPMWIAENELTVTTGIVIPAVNELKKYRRIIGMNDTGSEQWWTRSPFGLRGYDGNWVMNVTYDSGTAVLTGIHSTTSSGVRPMFYVNSEFFNNVKLTSAGTKVLEQMKKSSLYTDEEWAALNSVQKNGVNITVPKNMERSSTGGVSVSFDVARSDSADYVIEYSCNGNDMTPVTKAIDGKFRGTVDLPFENIENGFNEIVITVRCNGNAIAHYTGETIVTENYIEAIGDYGVFRGFVGHTGYAGSKMQADFLESGANMVRGNINWNYIEDGNDGRGVGDYDWAEMDAFYLPLLENGIEPIVLLCYGNSLYGETTYTDSAGTVREAGLASKEMIDGMATFAKAVAQHYKDLGYELKYFEFWNEANAGTWTVPVPLGRNDYSNAMSVVSNAIKEVLPDAVIIGGSLSGNDPNFMKTNIANGYNSADAFSYHPYMSSLTSKKSVDDVDFNKVLTDMNLVNLKYGGWKQNWITEFGASCFDSEYGFTEHEQAMELVKETVMSDAAYIDANTQYSYKNPGNVTTEFQHNWGVVRANGDLKESYIAMQALMNNIGGARYVGKAGSDVTGDENINLYIYVKEGKALAVAWNKTGNESSLNIGGNVTVKNMNNNTVQKNTSVVDITEEPCYIDGLDISWVNKALSESFIKKIDESISYAELDSVAGLFDGTKANIVGISGKTELVDVSGYIDTHYAIADTLIASRDTYSLTDKQLSALLYIIHESGEMLISYSMLNKADSAVVNSRERYTSLFAEAESKEAAVIAGLMPYTKAMLTMADRYIDIAEKTASQKVDSEYKNAVISGYNSIANRILDMAEGMIDTETVTNSNISMQIPLFERTLEEQSTSYYKTGSLNVSVYNFGDVDIENGTIELQTKAGTIGTAELNVPAGESVQVNISFRLGKWENLWGDYNTYMKLVAKSSDGVAFAESYAEATDRVWYYTGMLTE